MGDYVHRIADAFLGSELLPVRVRMSLMRAIGFRVSADASIWPRASFRSKRVTIGPGVFLNVGFFHDGYDELTIRDNVRVGQFVRVITATHDIGPPHQRGLIEVVGKPVTIEKGCWIGSAVTILPGVTIARGCVIAAGAIVATSTEPDGLYAGLPARRIRDLPDAGGALPSEGAVLQLVAESA